MCAFTPYYKISQPTVNGFGENLHVIGEKDQDYKINIKLELEKFTEFIQLELSKISNHILNIKGLFSPDSNIYIKLSDDLHLVKEKMKGGLVIEDPKGKKLILNVHPNQNEIN